MKLEDHWYRSSLTWLTVLLLPFSWLFRAVVALRYAAYRYKFKKTTVFPVPVIVVGNITVGGTGKTPFVIWLAHFLQRQGYHPGIVTRGVGGQKQLMPYWIDAATDAAFVGDEAVLLARRAHCPVVICVDRVAAVKELLANSECDIVISDDGLQHYRLGRTLEIVMQDGLRKLGNQRMLPAGPLREPVSRLQRADVVVVQGEKNSAPYTMQLKGSELFSLRHHVMHVPLENFAQQTVHAIAGIGNPTRFFAALRQQNITVIEHVFPDHYLYRCEDIYFPDNLPVVMTEKDAVKCFEFADEQHWYLPVNAEVSDELADYLSDYLPVVSSSLLSS